MTTYRRPVPLLWWLGTPAYVRFAIRELTCVFIAAYVILLLILIVRIAAGPAAYEAYLRWLQSPALVAFHVVALAAAVYHTLTWLRLAPLAVVVRVRGRRVPPSAIIGGNVAAWIAISVVLGWIILRG
ncbi:MAG: fumarate reductase subunit C [bacterium]